MRDTNVKLRFSKTLVVLLKNVDVNNKRFRKLYY